MAKKHSPGDRPDSLDSATWNLIGEHETLLSRPAPSGNDRRNSGASRLTVAIQNNSEADIDALWPVLKITGPVFNTDDDAAVAHRQIALTGDVPDSETTTNDIVIVQGPIPDGVLRSAVLRGMTWCRLLVNDLDHEFAAPVSGVTTYLESSEATGAAIIWRSDPIDSLPEEVDALVMLGGGGAAGPAGTLRLARVTETGGIVAATLNGTAIAPSSGEGKLFVQPGTPGDDWPPDDGSITIYSHAGDVLEEDAVVWIDDEGYVVSQFCTPPAAPPE